MSREQTVGIDKMAWGNCNVRASVKMHKDAQSVNSLSHIIPLDLISSAGEIEDRLEVSIEQEVEAQKDDSR